VAIDYTTSVGQVRLLISDVASSPADWLLTDEQVNGYLSMNGGAVKLAAADALDAIASSETLVSKAIRTQDLATNGPAVAQALRAHAATLRDQAGQADADGMFDVIYPEPTLRPAQLEQELWGM
jgi:hypothetical protein